MPLRRSPIVSLASFALVAAHLIACGDDGSSTASQASGGAAGQRASSGDVGTGGSGGSPGSPGVPSGGVMVDPGSVGGASGALVGFVGATTTIEEPVSGTEKLLIRVNGGKTRIGPRSATAITVNGGAPSGKIKAVFTPVAAVAEANKDALAKQFEDPAKGGNLTTSLAVEGGVITVNVVPTGAADPSLSATVDVLLPPGFTGAIDAQTQTGDVTVSHGYTDVSINTGLGSISADLGSSVIKPDGSGSLETSSGDITFTLPTGARSPIQAVADGPEASVDGLPGAGWVVDSASPASKTFNAPMNLGQPWQLRTGFGRVQISWR